MQAVHAVLKGKGRIPAASSRLQFSRCWLCKYAGCPIYAPVAALHVDTISRDRLAAPVHEECWLPFRAMIELPLEFMKRLFLCLMTHTLAV